MRHGFQPTDLRLPVIGGTGTCVNIIEMMLTAIGPTCTLKVLQPCGCLNKRPLYTCLAFLGPYLQTTVCVYLLFNNLVLLAAPRLRSSTWTLTKTE